MGLLQEHVGEMGGSLPVCVKFPRQCTMLLVLWVSELSHTRLESHLSAYASSSGAPGKQPFVDVDSTVRPFLKLLDLRKKNNTSAFLSRFSYFTASSPQKLEVHKHRKDRSCAADWVSRTATIVSPEPDRHKLRACPYHHP